MSDWKQVGTVEVLKARVYPLDPNSAQNPLSTRMWVEPGVFPVYRKDDAYRWIFRGQINERVEKIGGRTVRAERRRQPEGSGDRLPIADLRPRAAR